MVDWACIVCILCRALRVWCCRGAIDLLSPLVPYILVWWRDYKFKSWLRLDLVSSITVAIVGIPQGLAYAKLANVDSVYGTAGCAGRC